MPEMRAYYWFCRFLCQGFASVYFKARCFGLRHVPSEGSVLLVCNHQSFMDPVLAAMALHRECSYMARESLFANPLFGRLITSVNAFPVRRNTADIGVIKEALRRLKQGRMLLMFPEGTRTPDGRVQPFMPGMGAIAKKTRVPIVPTLIDGVFQAWPRHQPLPSPGNVIIEYDRPIMPDEYGDLSADDLMKTVRQRIVTMQQRWHRRVAARCLE